MKIILDENIVSGKEAFCNVGEVTSMPGREINRVSLTDADVLIVRSVTNVNRELLEGTNIRFVGTATIGTDHIDTGYLSSCGISFAFAAGCNADSVKEYVFTALFYLLSRDNLSLEGLTIGVIGAGNIGSRVRQAAEGLGLRVLVSDPPLYKKTGDEKYISLNNFSECDIITLHVPLTYEGEDKTYHLLNRDNLQQVKPGAIILNTSRGGVADESVLTELRKEKGVRIVADVWEGEPEINTEFFNACDIATPHIAGYSYEGKLNGTRMIFESLCGFLGESPRVAFISPVVKDKLIRLDGKGAVEEELFRAASHSYDILRDHGRFGEVARRGEIPAGFDRLRKEYPVRREFGNYEVFCKYKNEVLIEKLEKLGFRLSLEDHADK